MYLEDRTVRLQLWDTGGSLAESQESTLISVFPAVLQLGEEGQP